MPLRLRRCRPLALALLLFAGCNTPSSVADFSSAAVASLAASDSVFLDIGGSCLRAKNYGQPLGEFTLVESDPACTAVGKQAEGAAAAADLLGAYFAALNALASFNTGKTSRGAGDLATQAAGAFTANTDAQTAIGSIAQFVTAVSTGAYQARSLAKDLTQVNGNVRAVTDGLASIVRTNYLGQELPNEERKMTTHFQEFAQAHPEGSVLLVTDQRWREEEDALRRRRTAALDVIASLNTIRDGTATLAAQAHSLKTKELPGLLQPYVEHLETMIPAIQKAF